MKNNNILRLRKIFLELLDTINQVCKEHNVPWFLGFGTLLGAVRESGFIEHDDDVDIMIPVEYIPTLLKAKWPDGYQMDYFGLGFYKFGRRGTLMINLTDYNHIERVINRSGIEGIHIDIFPIRKCDELDSNGKECCKVGFEDYILQSEVFNHSVLHKFEDREYPIPKEYDIVLRKFYGDDYNTPKVYHGHKTFIDFDNDQDKYAYGELRIPQVRDFDSTGHELLFANDLPALGNDVIKSTHIINADSYDIDKCIDILYGWKNITEWVAIDKIKDNSNLPNILDIVDSLLLIHNNSELSISRLADGELGLMTGVHSPSFQRFNDSLGTALKDIMTCNKPMCKVALPKRFFYDSTPDLSRSNFAASTFLPQALNGDYFKYIKNDYTYLDASLTVLKGHYPYISNKIAIAYYSIVKNIFKDKDILLVTGDDRCFIYQKNLLKDANIKSINVLKVPSSNAWDQYESIKKSILRLNSSGNKLVLLSCGPTASVLAYELSDYMRCLDVGHIFGDYNLAIGGHEIGYFWS